MSVNASEISSAVKFLKKGPRRMAFRDVIKTALGMADMPEGVVLDGVRTTGDMADVLQRIQGQTAFEELEQPKEFSGTLRPVPGQGILVAGLFGQVGAWRVPGR